MSHMSLEHDPFMRNPEHLLQPELDKAPVMSQEIGHIAVQEQYYGDPEVVEQAANYQGNWTNLALGRMDSADFRGKFDAWVDHNTAQLPAERTAMSREKVLASEYATRKDAFSAAREHVGSVVAYDAAEAFNHKPSALGTSEGFGETTAVFTDAPLTTRQKDIIAAHEMYHSLVDSHGSGPKELIRPGFDFGKVTEYNNAAKAAGEDKRAPLKYMSSPDELMARMAQLKNYYGMTGNEQFTQAHLDHARQHYVEDTNLDNNMTLFLEMAQDETFVELMNQLPV